MISKESKNEIKCPITRTVGIIGGKWTIPIIYVLMDDTKRFKDLERSIDGINTRMLVKELKRLEEDKVVIRKVFC